MTQEEVLNILQNIFRDVFDEDDLVIEGSTNAEDIEDWDSLNHINLISATEKELKITFALGELAGLKDVAAMIDLILEKIK